MIKLPDHTLAEFLTNDSIEWNFIPPRSPNHGGLWEAGVKAFKFHLKRVVGNAHLTLEEFITILCEIEAVLNSRPLTPLTSNFDDFETLTPGHFLVGRTLTSKVEAQISNINENQLSRWERVKKITQHIYKLWKRDCLNNLQERHKWKFNKNNISVGTLVLIKDENLPSTKWSTGRITEIFPGTDDGSLLDFAQGAGIDVFSHLYSFYLHAGSLTTHFDGEVEAIHTALQQLAVRLPPIERAVILSDSTSALQALSNYNENNCLRVQNCRELMGKIKGKIVFQWVPSHCGLWGNERADFLAKKGNGESFRLTASRVARDKPWSTLCKKSHGIPSSPRAAAVAKFRLLTGHDCLCDHLFRFNLVTSPICVLCDTGQDMTAAHLDECSALNDLNCIVKRYWRARCLMT
ncbi:integrase catalytic domain-containing protein [Trichonephila clavipes]|nr:integrase catalytic domain-containing protein [Trichonephila clavipes]